MLQIIRVGKHLIRRMVN